MDSPGHSPVGPMNSTHRALIAVVSAFVASLAVAFSGGSEPNNISLATIHVDTISARDVIRSSAHALPESGSYFFRAGWTERDAARFRNDVRAFSEDLERQGIASDRARRVAYLAVAEAYRFGIPPALVYGVLRIENATLRSNVVSSAGAVGLMQVMPSVWLSSLGPRYGYDLRDDATNIAMGVHILAHYYEASNRDWRRALLRYNGCVRGTNTPGCHRYPDRVRRIIEKEARSLCPTGSFERCVTIPLYYGFSSEELRPPRSTFEIHTVE